MNDGADIATTIKDGARSHSVDLAVIDPHVVAHEASKRVSNERHLVEPVRPHRALVEGGHYLTLCVDGEDQVSLALFELCVEHVEFLAQPPPCGRGRHPKSAARASERLPNLGLDRDRGQRIQAKSCVQAHPELRFDSIAAQLFFELEFRLPAGGRFVQERARKRGSDGQS
jgi:hypothetical protein